MKTVMLEKNNFSSQETKTGNQQETTKDVGTEISGLVSSLSVLSDEKAVNTKKSTPKTFETSYKEKLQKNEVEVEKMKKNYAKWLLKKAIELLWKEKKIFDEEFDSTIEYLENNYFETCFDKVDFEKIMKDYFWRLEKASKNIKKKEKENPVYSFNCYPRYYFDLDNKTGLCFKWD